MNKISVHVLFFIGRLIFTLFILFSGIVFAQKSDQRFKVVIDAGHGGKDSGTRGSKRSKVLEKDIALDVSITLGKMIERKMKRKVKVIYTRKNDTFIDLWRRAEIAQKSDADLFISIHCNASPRNHRAQGPESYVMGVARNNENLEVAKRENSVIKLEFDYKKRYKEWDGVESKIALGAMQSNFLEQSLLFSTLLNKFTKKAKRPVRRVKQAGFYVLRMVFMPSILIELGFLSNSRERKFLAKKKGRQIMAKSIFNAFEKYLEEITRRERYATTTGAISTDTPPATPAPTRTNKPSDIKKTTTTRSKKKLKSYKKSSVYFSIQLTISKVKLSKNHKVFSSFKPKKVRYYREAPYYKYTVGKTSTYAKALSLLKSAKKKGYPDAFIISFKKGKKISLASAIKETKI